MSDFERAAEVLKQTLERLGRAMDSLPTNAQGEIWQAEADQLCDALDRIIQQWEVEANK